MVVTSEIGTGELADLVKEAQAGREVLLTQAGKPVARLVAFCETHTEKQAPMEIRSVKGHRVLTQLISQKELAEEMFEGR